MTQETGRKTLPEAVRISFNRPPVKVYVDLVNARLKDQEDENGSLYPFSRSILRFAESIGRVDAAYVYGGFDLDAHSKKKEWRDYKVRIVEDGSSGSARFEMHLDLLNNSYNENRRIYIIIADNAGLYNGLARRLTENGNSVVVVGDEVETDNCEFIFCSKENMVEGGGHYRPPMPRKLDLDNYDFTDFIEVLNTSEEKMSFVGVSFFIRKVMWRLNIHSDTQKQQIFNKAQEDGIIELFERENIDKDAPKVSACRLNREHPLVKKVLGELETMEEDEDDGDVLSHRMDLSSFNTEEDSTDATI